MLTNATGFYVPEERIDNQRFPELNGLTSEWTEQRTGIHTRSRTKEEENINTMGLEAVKDVLSKSPYDITEVDLTVSASYSPYNTVATAAHTVRHEYTIADTKALYLSLAYSSFLNTLEVVEGYFTMGKTSRVLMLSVDRSSVYYNETNLKVDHLWDDVVAAFFISKERIGGGDAEIVEVCTQGLGHLPKAVEAVHLRPRDGGALMPKGRSVFIQAYIYMPKSILHLLEKSGYTLDNLTYFTGHQVNMHIMANIAKQLNLPNEEFLHDIEELGNTGSISSVLACTQNGKNFRKNDLIAIMVFGNGYSAGVCLIKHRY